MDPIGDAMEVDGPTPAVTAPNKSQATFAASERRTVSLPPPTVSMKNKTAYCYDITMCNHTHATEDHPEKPERIIRIMKVLQNNHIISQMSRVAATPITLQRALLVHSQDHCDKVDRIASMSEDAILETLAFYEQLSLYVHPGTTLAAKISCGGVVDTCLAVARGENRNAFAIVRPPGHHAEPDEHMGFCFYNNVAVAARVVQEETPLKRILILDWDVHHGNGTQKAFIDKPDVLYVSLHRHDNGTFYPGGQFGSITSCGEGAGLGTSVNIAWPEHGMGDAEYIYAFQRIVMPIAMEFAPDLVIVSAGFDAARGDDLGECDVTPAGYAHMTYMLCSLAGGKVVVALEGGYSLDAISSSSLAVARILLGEAPPILGKMVANTVATETVYQVSKVQSRYWKSINPKSCEPVDEEEKVFLPLSQLIKDQRTAHMNKTYRLLKVPFADPVLQETFNGLLMCSQDIYSKETMVLFLHDFGDLHVELRGGSNCEVDVEKSYILDASNEVAKWAIKEENFSFIDLNVFAHHPSAPRESGRASHLQARKVLLYVWDNYIQLSSAKSVFIVSYGGAGAPLAELLTTRSVTATVKGIIQVVGNGHNPAVVKPRSDAYDWFVKNTAIYCGWSEDEVSTLRTRKGIGRVETISKSAVRGVLLMKRCVPLIKTLVASGQHFGDPPGMFHMV